MGGNLALPPQFPTEFTAQKTPLVQQLHVEVYQVQGPKGQAGERWAGAVKTTAGWGKTAETLLPMGGDNGASDIAVGGHGIQLPPGRPMAGRKDRRVSVHPKPRIC